MFTLYLDKSGNLYSDDLLVDVPNVVMYVDGIFKNVSGSNITNSMGMVPITELTALEATISNNTLILQDKVNKVDFDTLAATKADITDALNPNELASIVTPTPVINSTLTSVVEGNDFTLTIEDFDPTNTYTITFDNGSYVLDTVNGIITFTANLVNSDISTSVTVTATKSGYLTSFPYILNLTITDIPYTEDQLLINSDLVGNEQETLGMV